MSLTLDKSELVEASEHRPEVGRCITLKTNGGSTRVAWHAYSLSPTSQGMFKVYSGSDNVFGHRKAFVKQEDSWKTTPIRFGRQTLRCLLRRESQSPRVSADSDVCKSGPGMKQDKHVYSLPASL